MMIKLLYLIGGVGLMGFGYMLGVLTYRRAQVRQMRQCKLDLQSKCDALVKYIDHLEHLIEQSKQLSNSKPLKG